MAEIIFTSISINEIPSIPLSFIQQLTSSQLLNALLEITVFEALKQKNILQIFLVKQDQIYSMKCVISNILPIDLKPSI